MEQSSCLARIGDSANDMGSAKQALPVQAMVMTPTEYPADAEECSNGGATEHPPQNPDPFGEKV